MWNISCYSKTKTRLIFWNLPMNDIPVVLLLRVNKEWQCLQNIWVKLDILYLFHGIKK